MKKNKKIIAVGIGKLLYFATKELPAIHFEYVLDNNYADASYEVIPVKKYDVLKAEELENAIFYVFAVSNHSINIIKERLSGYGVSEDQVFLYSDLFKESFENKIHKLFGSDIEQSRYDFSKVATLDSKLSVHTTICGSWLFLEALNNTKNISGSIAEVGCFEGGNALLALQSEIFPEDKKFLLFDSFDGFPALSEFDPIKNKQGDYKPTIDMQYINQVFKPFHNVQIIPGYVPDTFSHVNVEDKYSLVFYDCDLYQPALDTLNFFWPKMTKGGIVLMHDYCFEPGGFSGVKKATDEFCAQNGVEVFPIWESTMAVLRK